MNGCLVRRQQICMRVKIRWRNYVLHCAGSLESPVHVWPCPRASLGAQSVSAQNPLYFLTLKTGTISSSFSKERKTDLYLASKSSTVTSWFGSLSLLNLEVEVVSSALVFFSRLVSAGPLDGEDSGYVEVEDVGTFMFLPEVMSSPYPCWWAKAYAERRELVLRTLLRFCSWGPCRLVACWSKRTCGREKGFDSLLWCTLTLKSLGSVRLSLFIKQRWIKLFKSVNKDICIVTIDFYLK